jgi:integrase/recombinase XerD
MIELNKAHNNFVEHLKGLGRSYSTVIAYEKDIEQLINHVSKKGVEKVNEINLDHLKDFMEHLADKDFSNKTISRKTNSTKTFFKYLIDNNHIKDNIAEDLKHPKVKIKPPRILSRMEYGALRDESKNDHRSFAIIEILLQSGLRISELAAILLDHIEIHPDGTGVLFIPAKRSQHARSVPLNKSAVEAIKAYVDKERPRMDKSRNLFITKTGRPLLVRNIRATLDRLFKNAGIENATVNDLRHTFIAHHLKKGAALEYISKIVGHKRISTTERYLQYIEIDVEKTKAEVFEL